jgi:hypothetical protein
MYRIDTELESVAIDRLKPTQMTVGFAEVEQKRKDWASLPKAKRLAAMTEVLFPAVIGPNKQYYILDHHHTALALVQEDAGKVRVGTVKDLSSLSAAAFWIYLDHVAWVHPYDHHGKRRDVEDMPKTFKEMKDDPYRSLAGAVRDHGGFAKSDAPYLEFLWTNYFRNHVAANKLAKHPKAALKEALKLSHSEKTAYLPGWVGSR